jgi:hypothetical protein
MQQTTPNDDTMAELIYEAVITTCSPTGEVHVAPMGVRYADGTAGDVVLMPFKPSTTLRNIESTGRAVLNVVTDVRVFAGCVTGRRRWPTLPVREAGVRLACALGHVELALSELRDHEQRPVLRFKRLHEVQHAPFIGFNRAQAAVVEGAVLVSRLHLLSADKIDTEMRYLQIAIDKTAGAAELEAWAWLQEAIASHRQAAARASS